MCTYLTSAGANDLARHAIVWDTPKVLPKESWLGAAFLISIVFSLDCLLLV